MVDDTVAWAGRYFSMDGENPTAFPTDWSLGFISLTTTVGEIESVMGAADRFDEDAGYGPLSWWDLPGGAVLEVGSWYTGPGAVSYARLDVPAVSPVRFGLAGGVVLGTATVEQLGQAWGASIECADIGKSDCDVLYTRCVGLPGTSRPVLVTAGLEPGLAFEPTGRIHWVTIGEDQSPQGWEACAALTLTSGGLGVADLGDAESSALASLVRALGPASGDESFDDEPGDMHDGYPAEDRFRLVAWEDIGVYAVFSDGMRWPDGRTGSVLISWSYFPVEDPVLTLATDGGVTVGSSVDDLLAAHGDASVSHDDYVDEWRASLPSAQPAVTPVLRGLTFGLSGDPATPGTVITSISAGAAQAP